MRTLQTAFATHIASGATTLCTCWRLARTDGVVLGFTDHDVSLSFEGTDYTPTHGADSSGAAAKLGAATDTTEIVGLLDSAAISETDLRLGRYDGTEVQTWRVNWRDPEVRQLLRRDTIGEITKEDGWFRAELRSAQAALNRKSGRLYQSLCNTCLGTTQCGIDIEDGAYRAAATVTAIRAASVIAVSGLSAYAENWFGFGQAAWTSGQRDGLIDTIAAHRREAGVDLLVFDAPVGDWLAEGDTLTAFAGCDRLFSTCRTKYANAVNFRGFPHIPGSDFVLSYPKEGDDLAGQPLVS